jgi:diguanylate cyclase (GGDEF)-like protein
MKSLDTLNLKRKILISVSLVTIIPLIILLYYFAGFKISTIALLVMTFIVFLGWLVIFTVFSSVVKVYSSSRNTLEAIGEEMPAVTNEVESIKAIMDTLSVKVKDDLKKLRNFSEKTDELNREISKKVFVLSTILQANDLFSKEAPAEEIIHFLVENLKEAVGMNMCFCSLKDNISGDFKTIVCLDGDIGKIEDIIRKERKHFPRLKRTVKLDKENKTTLFLSSFREVDIKNVALVPIISRMKVMGVVGIGNNQDDFIFRKECLDVIGVFAQNIALVWEHKRLSSKVAELEIFDYLTGVYNRRFLVNRLDEEIKRSFVYQRPCGFLLMEVVNYADYQKEFGTIETEKLMRKIAGVYKDSMRPIDFIGRISSNSLGVILIEKNRRQSRQVADDLNKKLEKMVEGKVELAFSIAENPLNGMSAQELMDFATEQMERR